MGLLGDIRQFLGKYVSNPIIAGAIAFMTYKMLRKQGVKEYVEDIRVVKKEKDFEIIFDTVTHAYSVIGKGKVHVAKDKADANRILRSLTESAGRDYYMVQCPHCNAEFSTKIWDKIGDGYCPRCKKTYKTDEFKYLRKFMNNERMGERQMNFRERLNKIRKSVGTKIETLKESNENELPVEIVKRLTSHGGMDNDGIIRSIIQQWGRDKKYWVKKFPQLASKESINLTEKKMTGRMLDDKAVDMFRKHFHQLNDMEKSKVYGELEKAGHTLYGKESFKSLREKISKISNRFKKPNKLKKKESISKFRERLGKIHKSLK